jgi:putative transposase
MPFEFAAAAVLPDHAHFLWTLPPGDTSYSKQIGRMKVEFVRRLPVTHPARRPPTHSRANHRESGVWQRRFWEHTIRDEDDFKTHLDYIHFNPVKHGLVSCPHHWPYSSFPDWVKAGEYALDWGCVCSGRAASFPHLDRVAPHAGE